MIADLSACLGRPLGATVVVGPHPTPMLGMMTAPPPPTPRDSMGDRKVGNGGLMGRDSPRDKKNTKLTGGTVVRPACSR